MRRYIILILVLLLILESIVLGLFLFDKYKVIAQDLYNEEIALEYGEKRLKDNYQLYIDTEFTIEDLGEYWKVSSYVPIRQGKDGMMTVVTGGVSIIFEKENGYIIEMKAEE